MHCLEFGWVNFVGRWDKKENLKRLRFENKNIIPDVENYFYFDE
jgi:hypothetical protein